MARIYLQSHQTMMVLSLFLSSLAATRQQFLSELATTNFGLSMAPLVMSTIIYVGHMAQVLFLLDFWQSQKVIFFQLAIINQILIFYIADKVHSNDPTFRRFRRQLFHSSLSKMLSSLRPVMEKPEVVECSDGQYRRAIWGVGPYIGDYPEQVLLTCVVQGWCPRYLFTLLLHSMTNHTLKMSSFS